MVSSRFDSGKYYIPDTGLSMLNPQSYSIFQEDITRATGSLSASAASLLRMH
jgi:hypothetical protein